MIQIADLHFPDELRITSFERNTIGETNDIFFCNAEFEGKPRSVYIKIAKRPNSCLANEAAVLNRLASIAAPDCPAALCAIRAPRVLWHGAPPSETLVLEALPGAMVWDYIDPRRSRYDKDNALSYLRAYGECLGKIHSLPLDLPPQKRPRLYGFIGGKEIKDDRFQRLVSWLKSHAPARDFSTFVHGDLNTASVLFLDGRVSGVVDWEFAGSGWKEYDLAWVLRARTAFLNTQPERDAILTGYRAHSSYNPAALQWRQAFTV